MASDVQALALTGYPLDCALHLVLTVKDAVAARRLLAAVLDDGTVTFGSETAPGRKVTQAVNVGFTYRGLYRLGLSRRHREVLERNAPAFCEGATPRAARLLGDTGASAAETWHPAFAADRADMLVCIHGPDVGSVRGIADRLQGRRGAAEGFSGWEGRRIEAAHLTFEKDNFQRVMRAVHFGLRDNIARPDILERHAGQPHVKTHAAGELLLGHDNDARYNRWAAGKTVPEDVAAFFRNGSFAAMRVIQQHEDELDAWLAKESARLRATYPFATPTWLKAKLCGRWPNGALVRPGDFVQPDLIEADLHEFSYSDAAGEGCPFGAHIRRTNPRGDQVFPPRRRPLFRRGMPYGTAYDETAPPDGAERGLVGLFFCASIDDQFEHVMSEWTEKRPMGPPNRGHAKDPIIGQHDEPRAEFHIPMPHGSEPLVFGGRSDGAPFRPFVRTRGTLYALFPSRAALKDIARLEHVPPHNGPVPATGSGSTPIPGGTAPSTGEPSTASATPTAPATPTASVRAAPTASTAGTATRASASTTIADHDDETIDPAEAPADRFCDLVMEGGVTSGIVYAAAVAELAKHYRFKNIGGSSIGAFAAAVAAAAEYRRRQGSLQGFRDLRQLPRKLAEEDHRGRTLLQRLFRPQASTKRLYAIFLAGLGELSPASRVARIVLAALRQYWREVALALLLLFAIVLAGPVALMLRSLGAPTYRSAWESFELLVWLPAALATSPLALLAGMAVGVFRDLRRLVADNAFGLCRGWTAGDDDEKERPEKERQESEDDELARDVADPKECPKRKEPKKPVAPDLTGYLHATIQVLAGRDPLNDAPLTFKDLWNAPGAATDELGYRGGRQGWRSINLEVYTTNLTHGRPYRFPLEAEEDMGRLFFCLEELEDYFPRRVLQHLMAYSRPYEPKSRSDPPAGTQSREDLRELPVEDLPVVVAARLAMSFPGLVSAVPLWAMDYEPRKEERQLQRCWFSDGGLCSNFPIHLFDSFVPKWPTFGISLQARGMYRDVPVWLPDKHYEGGGDTWNRDLDADRPPLQRLGSFVVSLWMAAWRWNDMTMMRMPGVRDRVVRVLLKENEGGVNISMSGKQILAIADRYGRRAAHEFIDKFAEQGRPGWPEHRWVRMNRLLIALREQIEDIAFAAGLNRHTVPLHRQINDAIRRAPLRGHRKDPAPSEAPISAPQQRELRRLLRLLSNVERRVERAGNTRPFDAIPRPSLRVRHPT